METIYQQAIDTFGQESQFKKALEELAELSVKIAHFQDGKCTAADVAGEIADVEIMCEQLRLMIPDGLYLTHQKKAAKIDRLGQKIHNSITEQDLFEAFCFHDQFILQESQSP